ncbi:uncharacterized protein LOC134841440 isoform X2 [Symsagittifera roscoffensis]|uniref:uncharacterized protein LOC134841440 isoform X2 n=1 Tax=Symsagittifera roscoffensis TaxID=84072 RepID=UPI00307C190F
MALMDPFANQPAGLPSIAKSEFERTRTAQRHHQPKFSRWSSWEPAMHTPRPGNDHWAKMKTEVLKSEGLLPRFPIALPETDRWKSRKQETAYVSRPKTAAALSTSKTQEQQQGFSRDGVPMTSWERGTLPSVGGGGMSGEIHIRRRDFPSLRRRSSARETNVWNNSYHLKAKRGHIYWWEDPDFKHVTIDPHVKFGTPFGAYKSYFGIGSSPLK